MPTGITLRRSACLALAALLAGCTPAEYYVQGIGGQWELVTRAKPIDEVVRDTADARLKARLELARTARAFASSDLGLPDNATFTRYVDLGRPYVVWNVFAAPELSLAPRQWCFPVAGCVNYRGYFAERDANAEADRLAAAGEDVHLGGVPAYSTLGWFDDPLLSTFVRYPQTEFVRMMFHELAHQVAYVRDDTAFNESFAAAVEEEGVRRWIARLPHGPEREALHAELARSDRLRKEFRRLTEAARAELAALYASGASDAAKRRGKAEVFARLRAGYDAARAGEPGLAGYDRWFAGRDGAGPNNASLAAVALYADRVPAFRALLVREQGDLPRFYARVKELAGRPKAERDAALDALAPAAISVAR